MEHPEGGVIRPVYSLKTVVLVLLRLAVFTYGQEIDPCPGRFKLHGDICYRLISKTCTESWESANLTCSEYDAKVVEPRNHEVNQVVKEMVFAAEYAPWLGGSPSSTNEEKWEWNSDRNLMTWTNWKPFETWGTEDNCMIMKDDGHWYRQLCSGLGAKKSVVICQKEKRRAGHQSSAPRLAVPSILMSVCLSAVALCMMQVF